MRIATYEGRLVVVAGGVGHEVAHDVEKNSGGRFGPEPQAIYEDWDAFTGWAAGARWEGGAPVRPDGLGSPAPAPRQVFGIGLNYRDHAAESGLPVPAGEPPVFTKFPSCITGPHGDIELPPGGHVDWEVELVAVIGRHARHVPAERALEYVAGYAVGQDISERVLQLAAAPPQFSMGKSLPGFGRSQEPSPSGASRRTRVFRGPFERVIGDGLPSGRGAGPVVPALELEVLGERG
jgi:2,4-didehydro-3-deoxy-L-rhamnonate hydrolase